MEDPAFCPKCKGEAFRFMAPSRLQKGIVHKDLKTDFGDGDGERTYTRREYTEKCKKLDREPAGLMFNNLRPTRA